MKDIIDRDTVTAEVLKPEGMEAITAAPSPAAVFSWRQDSVLKLEQVGIKYEADGIASLEGVNLSSRVLRRLELSERAARVNPHWSISWAAFCILPQGA